MKKSQSSPTLPPISSTPRVSQKNMNWSRIIRKMEGDGLVKSLPTSRSESSERSVTEDGDPLVKYWNNNYRQWQTARRSECEGIPGFLFAKKNSKKQVAKLLTTNLKYGTRERSAYDEFYSQSGTCLYYYLCGAAIPSSVACVFFLLPLPLLINLKFVFLPG